MVKLKYAVGEVPLRNEHSGYTFQSARIGQTAMSGQKNDRNRNYRQINKKLNLMQAVTNWRNLSAEAKANWYTFATNYPQPTKADPTKFLTGYQLFIKRQQYLYLNEGIKSEFLEAPFSEVLILDNYTFSVDQTENCIDVTENYIRNFGLIPTPGKFLLIKVLAYSVNSGQFFPTVTQTIEILESYIDGLFVSLHLPANCRNTVFSVYLSRPYNQSVKYSGTKTRYMGCFTTKTFLGLTDTPDSYVGQAGKKVIVKADESGLEFVPDAGGGLTCADLPACPTIISMNSDIDILTAALLNSVTDSLPSVKYGRLFNWYAGVSPLGLAPVGFHVPIYWQELEAVGALLGGMAAAGGKLKSAGLNYWLTPNTGADASSGIGYHGAGYRANGNFAALKQTTYIGTQHSGGATGWGFMLSYNSAAFGEGQFSLKTGKSYIFIKDDSNFVPYVAGNDGTLYKCVKIGNYVLTAQLSAETKFRDGSLIPTKGANGINYTDLEWNALTTPASCPYNNDVSNVYI